MQPWPLRCAQLQVLALLEEYRAVVLPVRRRWPHLLLELARPRPVRQLPPARLRRVCGLREAEYGSQPLGISWGGVACKAACQVSAAEAFRTATEVRIWTMSPRVFSKTCGKQLSGSARRFAKGRLETVWIACKWQTLAPLLQPSAHLFPNKYRHFSSTCRFKWLGHRTIAGTP